MALEGIETGYEGAWDFPEYSGSLRPYLLASVPRTGSTYVSHLLWETGCLGAPLEYLNFAPSGPYGDAAASRERQRERWEAALRHRTSPNGVFGIKAFPLILQDLGQLNPPLLAQTMRFLLRGQQARVVQLRRRDRQAHAISYARAMLSGIWRAEQESGEREEPTFDERMLERATQLIDAQENAWEAMYRDMRITPLVLWYEDAIAAPREAQTQVAAYIGVELDHGATVKVPPIRRQSQAGARSWKAELADKNVVTQQP